MSQDDLALLEKFVSSFEKFDELLAIEEFEPDVLGLTYGVDDASGLSKWRPARIATDPVCLRPLYERLPARFPPLYEKLLLNYRWARVELNGWRLCANPLAHGLGDLFLMRQITHDPEFTGAMFSQGYMQFGMGADYNYDPVCFDTRRRRGGGDCPVVQLDHEGLILKKKAVKVREVARTFRSLIWQTIEDAERQSPPEAAA